MRLAVIGAGVAGTAAAWKARRAGAAVTVFHHRAGLSALSSGALDLAYWEDGDEPRALDADVVAFAAALGNWTIGQSPCRVATDAGLLRTARGIDAALLDLAPLAGSTVAIADATVSGWDAPLLARALSESRWAAAAGVRFAAVAVPALASAVEGRYPPHDFAALHDDPARAAFLCQKLRETRAPCDAWLLGPWLGLLPSTADAVRERLGVPCGETTSAPGGPAGARFEAARDDLFAARGIATIPARVVKVAAEPGGLALAVDTDLGEPSTERYDSVVLALGGVGAGGILLDDMTPRRGGVGQFHLSLALGSPLSLDGQAFDHASSLYGVDVYTAGLDSIERVGVAVRDDGTSVVGMECVYAAGDVVAARPRTMLEAARAGAAAARTALGRSSRRG